MSTTTATAKQAEQKEIVEPKFKTINLNGQNATMLAPNMMTETPLAIIPKSLLDYLRGGLPTGDLKQTVGIFAEDLLQCESFEEYLKMLANEYTFHKAVNMVNEYFIEEEGDKPIVVGMETIALKR